MNKLFITVLLMSAVGALLVLCLSLLRPVTKKWFGAAWHYRIYMLVIFFLLVPIGEAGASLLGAKQNVTGQGLPNVPVMLNEMMTVPQNNVTEQQQEPQNTSVLATAAPTAVAVSPAITLNRILSYVPFVWLIGALTFVIWQAVQLIRFKRKLLRTSLEIENEAKLSALKSLMAEMRIKGRIHLFSNNIVKTPMLVGLFKTYLILPEVEMSDRELSVILNHELIHFKRRDLWVKSLALAANAIHWFNPAVYRLTKNIDTFCELSCDEQVVSDMSIEERQFYGETILHVLCRVVSQHAGVYTTLAESKKGIERRLTHMINVRKNTKQIALISFIVAAFLCISGFVAVSLMNTNGEKNTKLDDLHGMAKIYYDYLTSLGEIETERSSTVGGGFKRWNVNDLYYYLDDFNDDKIIDLAISAEDLNGFEIYTYKDGQVEKFFSKGMPYSAGSEMFTLAKYDGTYGIKSYRFNSMGDYAFYRINKDGYTEAVFYDELYDGHGNYADTATSFYKIHQMNFYRIEELKEIKTLPVVQRGRGGVYRNEEMGFELTFPEDWKDCYHITEYEDTIWIYFIGESQLSRENPTYVKLFYIGLISEGSDGLNGGFANPVKLGSKGDKSYYKYTNTDYQIGNLSWFLEFPFVGAIDDPAELDLLARDVEKAIAMNEEISNILTTFKLIEG